MGLLEGLGLSAGQSLLNQAFAKRNMQMSVNANKELQANAFDYNMQAWNAQNAYNSPAAQMQRLQEAGLNPRLVYGNSGQAAMIGSQTAKELPKYQQPAASMNAVTPNIANNITAYQDIKMKQAQINLVKEQARREATEANYNEAIAWERTARFLAQSYMDRGKASVEQALYEGPYTPGVTPISVARPFNISVDPRTTPQYEAKLAALKSEIPILAKHSAEADVAYYDSVMKGIDSRWYRWAKGVGLAKDVTNIGLNVTGAAAAGRLARGSQTARNIGRSSRTSQFKYGVPKKFSPLWWTMTRK
jgi:hypothetical protein